MHFLGLLFRNRRILHSLSERPEPWYSITRNTIFQTLTPDGGTKYKNLRHTYTTNTVSRFHFKLYGETDGNLNIVVDENILKAIEDKVIVPNY